MEDTFVIHCECGACGFFSRFSINLTDNTITLYGTCFQCGSRIIHTLSIDVFLYGGEVRNEA